MELRAKSSQILYLVAVQLEQDLNAAGIIHSPGLDLLASWRTADDALAEVERMLDVAHAVRDDNNRDGLH